MRDSRRSHKQVSCIVFSDTIDGLLRNGVTRVPRRHRPTAAGTRLSAEFHNARELPGSERGTAAAPSTPRRRNERGAPPGGRKGEARLRENGQETTGSWPFSPRAQPSLPPDGADGRQTAARPPTGRDGRPSKAPPAGRGGTAQQSPSHWAGRTVERSPHREKQMTHQNPPDQQSPPDKAEGRCNEPLGLNNLLNGTCRFRRRDASSQPRSGRSGDRRAGCAWDYAEDLLERK